jgi:hypothetical protein
VTNWMKDENITDCNHNASRRISISVLHKQMLDGR